MTLHVCTRPAGTGIIVAGIYTSYSGAWTLREDAEAAQPPGPFEAHLASPQRTWIKVRAFCIKWSLGYLEGQLEGAGSCGPLHLAYCSGDAFGASASLISGSPCWSCWLLFCL